MRGRTVACWDYTLQRELERTREMIQGATNAMNYKLDASIYKKDAQLYLMNQQYNEPQIHKNVG